MSADCETDRLPLKDGRSLVRNCPPLLNLADQVAVIWVVGLALHQTGKQCGGLVEATSVRAAIAVAVSCSTSFTAVSGRSTFDLGGITLRTLRIHSIDIAATWLTKH